MKSWPATLHINAWTGTELLPSKISSKAKAWTLRAMLPDIQPHRQVSANAVDWRDEHAGWGLVLAEHEGLSEEVLASGADAPEAIQALLKARSHAQGKTPVFRYRPHATNRFTHLRNYATGQDVAISTASMGLTPEALPQYLLIYGSPSTIPWQLQYMLNVTRSTGRLDLEGDALEYYVQALLHNWRDAALQVDQTVLWSADFQTGDGQATNAALLTALARKKPGLVITSSYGQCGPLSNPTAMRATLGLPVDQECQMLDIEEVVSSWEPDGAIWYAHACCSAGSDASTLYGCLARSNPAICLVETGSSIDQVLRGIAGIGACTAPLPEALLGAKKPLRAFIGHVEPSFDWTRRHPVRKRYHTEYIQQALQATQNIAHPIGLACSAFYNALTPLCLEYETAFNAYSRGEDTLGTALYCQLAAREIQSLVLLGDPIAMLHT